jgi:WD40 repeat protein
VGKKFEAAHSKGIQDVVWLDDENFMTCSSDNTVKIWNISGDVHKVLNVSEEAEKVELQQVAVCITEKKFYSVSLTSDINVFHGADVFEKDVLLPMAKISGHKNHITSMVMLENGKLISGDQDNRILCWENDVAKEF